MINRTTKQLSYISFFLKIQKFMKYDIFLSIREIFNNFLRDRIRLDKMTSTFFIKTLNYVKLNNNRKNRISVSFNLKLILISFNKN